MWRWNKAAGWCVLKMWICVSGTVCQSFQFSVLIFLSLSKEQCVLTFVWNFISGGEEELSDVISVCFVSQQIWGAAGVR